MGNAFEEAMHHGYSAADMETDMQEQMDDMRRLGCNNCVYIKDYHSTCANVISNAGNYIKCPFFRMEV